MNVVIIGNGLFGSVIRAALRAEGHSVTVIDDERLMAGSKPAACLMKPSWFSSLGKDIYDPALAKLDELYGVQELQFRLGPTKVGGVFWVPPKRILDAPPDILGTVRHVRGDHLLYTSHPAECLIPLEFDVCIVAAGWWSNQLVEVPNLKGQAGVAFTWNRLKCEERVEPFVRPWAPYRQIVGFMRDEQELWAGDGTSIKIENWKSDRTVKSLLRCSRAITNDEDQQTNLCLGAHIQFGVRPQIRGVKHAYLKKISPKVWVATGGAKNGTIGAAWCADQLVRAL